MRTKLSAALMVKEEPVSLTRQTIYCIIPILDLYAAYRVKSLRKYLVIMLAVGIPLSIVDSYLFPMPEINENMNDMEVFEAMTYGYTTERVAVMIAEQIGLILLAIYLVRRWSKKWNKKFEGSA